MAAVRKVSTQEPGVFKWEVSFHLDGRSSKRIRRRFDRRSDAETFLENFKKEQNHQKSMGTSSADFETTTFGKEGESWLERSKLTMSPSSYARVQGILQKEILPEYGNVVALKLTVARITDLQHRLLRRGKAPRTVNREIGVIKAILNFSARHQRLPYNPSLHVRPLKATKTDMMFWEPEEARIFLRFADEKYPTDSPRRWIYVVYLMALNTGMRSGEIWGLQPQDLQKNRDLIHVVRQFDYYVRELRPCKGRTERYVPCHSTLRKELENLVKARKLSRDSLFFVGQFGNPIEDHSFKRHFFRKDLKESGAREIRFHDLRHTAATLMIAGGVDLPTVQSILDHKHITTTMHYVHLLGDSVQRVAGRFSVLPETTPALTIG